MSVAAAGAPSPTISIDRSHYFTQTGASILTSDPMPFSLNFHIRGDPAMSMTAWGPAFYIPGSGGTPQSGTSSDTVTGTLNFPATPNNYSDYMFVHDFETNAAMQSFYPIAPTDGGAYGVKFLGSAPPTPAAFTAGLVFAAGTTYPSVTPQITSADNGAAWVGNKLRIKRTGTTTLHFNALPEYDSSTYGVLMNAGFQSVTGALADLAKESGHLPMGDSSKDPEEVYYPPITDFAIDGSLLTPAQDYVFNLQYMIIAGRPEEANLNGVEFQGYAAYKSITSITLMLQDAARADFNNDGKSDIIWRNTNGGNVVFWLMNGTTPQTVAEVTPVSTDWEISGTGDFNNDGKSDIVWRHKTGGNVVFWLMNGNTPQTVTEITPVSTDWVIAGTGDFNGDGHTDIVWRHKTGGNVVFWFMNGTSATASQEITPVSTDWSISTTGDFNNDGKTDIVWRHNTGGNVVFWMMNGTSVQSSAEVTPVSTDWTISTAGDFNNDGKTDIVWRHKTGGNVCFWLMDGTTVSSVAEVTPVSTDWQIANH
ncbi:MAG TPA: VCBS repeat-containing protein [Lacunisphaera sp.]|nr:VCBS repeat-containing protein [Lacunisphaera sp.]